MTDRWNVGESPSLMCGSDRHEECTGYDTCTCRCHYWNGPGIEPVRDNQIESDGCAPDCPFCNGTDDAPCFCGPTCEGNRPNA